MQIYGSCLSRDQQQLKPEKKGCGTRISPYGSRHAQGKQSNTSIGMVRPQDNPVPLRSCMCHQQRGSLCGAAAAEIASYFSAP